MKKTVITSAVGSLLLCLASCPPENGAQVSPPAAGGGKDAPVTLTGSMDLSRIVPDGPTSNRVGFTDGDAVGVWDGSGEWKKFTVSGLSDEVFTAMFTGTARGACPYYIQYPYMACTSVTFDSGNITVNVPVTQAAILGTTTLIPTSPLPGLWTGARALPSPCTTAAVL